MCSGSILVFWIVGIFNCWGTKLFFYRPLGLGKNKKIVGIFEQCLFV